MWLNEKRSTSFRFAQIVMTQFAQNVGFELEL